MKLPNFIISQNFETQANAILLVKNLLNIKLPQLVSFNKYLVLDCGNYCGERHPLILLWIHQSKTRPQTYQQTV